MFLGILGWLALGVVIGLLGTKLVNLRGDDPRLSIGVTAVGALAGGALYTLISGDGVSGWNAWSLVCAAVGAIAGAVVWHVVRSRYISHDSYTVRRSY